MIRYFVCMSIFIAAAATLLTAGQAASVRAARADLVGGQLPRAPPAGTCVRQNVAHKTTGTPTDCNVRHFTAKNNGIWFHATCRDSVNSDESCENDTLKSYYVCTYNQTDCGGTAYGQLAGTGAAAAPVDPSAWKSQHVPCTQKFRKATPTPADDCVIRFP